MRSYGRYSTERILKIIGDKKGYDPKLFINKIKPLVKKLFKYQMRRKLKLIDDQTKPKLKDLGSRNQ